MAVTIGSNISALKIGRAVEHASESVNNATERLSSGFRINRGSDDAAGLAIATSLDLKAKVYNQGVRNLSDGLSAVSIAEGAYDSLSNIITRMKELTFQSANGTYSNTQRSALDREFQALFQEYSRVVQTTTFNGRSLLSTTSSDISLQGGFGSTESLTHQFTPLTTFAGLVTDSQGTGTFTISGTYNHGDSVRSGDVADVNGDGKLDVVIGGGGSGITEFRLGNGDGTLGNSTQYILPFGQTPRFTKFLDVNNDSTLDLVSGGTSVTSVFLGNGNGTFGSVISSGSYTSAIYQTFADFNEDNKLDTIVHDSVAGELLLIGNGNGTFANQVAIPTIVDTVVDSADMNNDSKADVITYNAASRVFYVQLGNGNGTFQSAATIGGISDTGGWSLGDVNADGYTDLISTRSNSTYNVHINSGNGTTYTTNSYATGVAGRPDAFGILTDINQDGKLDLVLNDSAGVDLFFGNGNGTFGSTVSTGIPTYAPPPPVFGDLNGDGVPDMVYSGAGTASQVYIADATTAVVQGAAPSIATRSGALTTMSLLDSAQDELATARSTVGAFRSRVEIAIRNLGVRVEGATTAEARIRDADVATESANLVRSQIVQQTAQAVLAQANVQPTLAITLLRNA